MKKLPRDIEATIKFLSTQEGGRKVAVHNGDRGQFHYSGEENAWDASHEYPDLEKVEPGETAKVFLSFLSPIEHVERIKEGISFEIREGYRLIGNGIVTKIIDLPESASRYKTNET